MIDELDGLEQESIERGIPIVGREKGMWLLYKVQELRPKKVLELGTANGYSGCILGAEGAQVITVEVKKELTDEAKRNFQRHQVMAEVINDDAVEVLKELLVDEANIESFDMVFIDFTKKKYNEVLDDCMRLVKVGGHIIADNITFADCQDFKQRIKQHPRLSTTFVNIRDGMSCSKRLE